MLNNNILGEKIMHKSLRLLAFCMLFCMAIAANATVKILTTNSTSTSWTSTADSYSGVIEGLTLTCEKGTGNSLGTCTNTVYIQIKKGNVFTIEAGGESITKVTFNCSGNAQKMTIDGTDVAPDGSTLTWTGSTTKFQATNAGTPMKVTSIEVTYGAAASDGPAAPTFTGAETFSGSSDVVITGEEGTVVYYTTDGTVPTTSSLTNNTNTVTVTLKATTTVQAIAVKDGKTSEMTTQKYICFEGVTIADLNNLTSDKSNVMLTLTNAKVIYTYYNGYFAYVREGDYAIRLEELFFKKDIKANSIINGTIILDYNNYDGAHAVKGNGYTTFDNLTITESEEAAQPVKTTISELLELKHKEDLVQIEGVTFSVTKGSYQDIYSISDADNNTISDIVAMTDVDDYVDSGKSYTVTAVFDGVSSEHTPQLVIIDVLDPTGIDSISADEAQDDATLYNIVGQKVNDSYKGIVIKNGKKIFNGK